jgi:hypothetical protein
VKRSGSAPNLPMEKGFIRVILAEAKRSAELSADPAPANKPDRFSVNSL